MCTLENRETELLVILPRYTVPYYALASKKETEREGTGSLRGKIVAICANIAPREFIMAKAWILGA